MITEGLSDSKLKWGYWYVTHKVILRQILIYTLIFINLNLWLFAIFFVFKVYIFDNKAFAWAVDNFANSKVNYSIFNKANQPKLPKLSNISILKTSGNKYDLLLTINNPNPNWTTRISGKFIIGEQEYEDKVISILGSDQKYVIEAGVEASSRITSPEFKINYIQWQRIRNRDEFNRFVKERSEFSINKITYHSPAELNLGTQVPVGGISFEIKNNTLFDYWLVNNKILFKRAGSVVAAHIIPLDEFRSGQNRLVDFRLFGNLVNISSVEVKPDIDIFDDENIIEEPLVVGYLK
jgi:hypothetical protein